MKLIFKLTLLLCLSPLQLSLSDSDDMNELADEANLETEVSVTV